MRSHLEATAAGRQILQGIDFDGDHTVSDQELAIAWEALRRLGDHPGVCVVQWYPI